MEKILNVQQVPGFTTPGQHRCYEDIIQKLPENPRILEVGCLYGKSTWGWLDVLPPNGSLTVVDSFTSLSLYKSRLISKISPENAFNFIWYAEDNSWIKPNWQELCHLPQYKLFEKIIHQHPCSEQLKEVHNILSEEYRNLGMSKDFDCVYLDDDHNYNNVLDWLHYFDKVPIICGDDITLHTVSEALREYQTEQGGALKFTINYRENFWYLERA